MQAVLREAMEAGAAGFATSFAPTHRGVDGLPIPSRFAERRRARRAARHVGRGRARRVLARARRAVSASTTSTTSSCAPACPSPTARCSRTPTGGHKRSVELNHEGWDARRAGVAAGEPAAADVRDDDGVAVHRSTSTPSSPRSWRARSTSVGAAYADPEWRAQALATPGTGRAGFGVPDWDTYKIVESTEHPELLDRRARRRRRRAGADAVRRAARPRARRARPRAAGARGARSTTTPTRSRSSSSTSTARSACPTPAPTSASCATRPSPPTSSATGCATATSCRIETAVRKLTGAQADLLGLADRGYLREGAWADVVVFDPDTVAPGPAAPGARLPRRRRAPHRRSAHRRAPRARERHAGAGRRRTCERRRLARSGGAPAEAAPYVRVALDHGELEGFAA